jgi:hypothetical protein
VREGVGVVLGSGGGVCGNVGEVDGGRVGVGWFELTEIVKNRADHALSVHVSARKVRTYRGCRVRGGYVRVVCVGLGAGGCRMVRGLMWIDGGGR